MTDIPVYRILKDPTRQNIIRYVGSREQTSYSDMLTYLNISTGRLNYHLKVLSPFMEKTNGNYILNEQGENMFSLISAYPGVRNPSGGNMFRPLGWLFLAISVSTLYFVILDAIIAVQFVAIVSLLISAFFFYYSGETKFRFGEFMILLIISLFIAVFSFSINFGGYPPGYFDFQFPYLILSVIMFTTFMAWSAPGLRRLFMVFAVMLFISVISIIGASSVQYGPAPVPLLFMPLLLLARYAVSGTFMERISKFFD